MPDRRAFIYTFARFAELMDGLLNQLGVERYALYVQDYGAPVGFRLALRHPARITALVVQNGNAYEEGLKEFWNPIKAYWADGSDAHRAALRAGLTLAATKSQYLNGVRDPSRVSPDAWLHDQALLDRPGIDEIMLDLATADRECRSLAKSAFTDTSGRAMRLERNNRSATPARLCTAHEILTIS